MLADEEPRGINADYLSGEDLGNEDVAGFTVARDAGWRNQRAGDDCGRSSGRIEEQQPARCV